MKLDDPLRRDKGDIHGSCTDIFRRSILTGTGAKVEYACHIQNRRDEDINELTD